MATLVRVLRMWVVVVVVGTCLAPAGSSAKADPPPPTVWYVDGSDGVGQDAAGRGGDLTPFATIGYAGQHVQQPGDTVVVRPKIMTVGGQSRLVGYNETISLPFGVNGTSDRPIVFKAENRGKTILDGQDTMLHAVSLNGHNHVRIEGFEIRRYKDDAVFLHDRAEQTVRGGFEVVGNYIHHCGNYVNWGDGSAIQASNVSDTLIQDNEITWCGSTAIRLGGAGNLTDRVTIRHNNIHHVGGDGIQGIGNNVLIEYNRMYDSCFGSTHQDALQMSYCNNIIVRYNVIGDFTQLVYGGVDRGGGQCFQHLYVYGNVFYNSNYWNQDQYHGGSPGVYIGQGKAAGTLVTGDIEVHSNTFLFLGEKAIYLEADGSESSLDRLRIYNNIFYACRGLGNTSGARHWEAFAGGMTDIQCDYNCYYGYGYSYATLGFHGDDHELPGDLSYYDDPPLGLGCDQHSLVLAQDTGRLLESYDLVGPPGDLFNARVKPQYWEAWFDPDANHHLKLRTPLSVLTDPSTGVHLPPHLDGQGDPIFSGDGPLQDMDGHIRPSSDAVLMGAYEGRKVTNQRLQQKYDTIQEALGDALIEGGDVLVVTPGTYEGVVDFGGKNLTLKSSDPRDPAVVAATIIDAHGASAAVELAGDPDGSECNLEGLTIRGGSTAAVQVLTRKATIANCIITNSAGAGIVEAEDLADIAIDPLGVYNCQITNNDGGGISIAGVGRLIQDCTIADNGDMGIRVAQQAGASVSNCIIWGNAGQQIGGDGTATVRYCDVEGGAAGTGNSSANPQFVNPAGMDGDLATHADNDYRLWVRSPCIDTGSNATSDLARDTLNLDADNDWAEAVPLDLGGNGRICAGTVDKGAHEVAEGAWVWTVTGTGDWTQETSWIKQGAPDGWLGGYPDTVMYAAYVDNGGTVEIDSTPTLEQQAGTLHLGPRPGTSGSARMEEDGRLTISSLGIAEASSAVGTFTLHGGYLHVWNVGIRTDAQAGAGVFDGYGTVYVLGDGTLNNNGVVLATGDAGGNDQTLDLSGFYLVNSIDNPAYGTCGWYATNHGKLVLPEVYVKGGARTCNWGQYEREQVCRGQWHSANREGCHRGEERKHGL